MTLQGKHALVSGASRGIGCGIVLKLAKQGATVAVHYSRNDAAAKETLERVRTPSGDGILVQADVSRPDEVRPVLAEVKDRFGTRATSSSPARGRSGRTSPRSRWRSRSSSGTSPSTPGPRRSSPRRRTPTRSARSTA